MMKNLSIIALLIIALPVSAQTWANYYTGSVSGPLNAPTNSVTQTPGATLTTQSQGTPGTVGGYQPLEPLKGTFNGTNYTSFADYLATIYKLCITIGGLVAVVMLATGGVRYMLSESFTDKSAAKKRIASSLWGLTILVGSFLILYTINPNLLSFKLGLPEVKNSGSSNFSPITGGTSNISPGSVAYATQSQSEAIAKADTDAKGFYAGIVNANDAAATNKFTQQCQDGTGVPGQTIAAFCGAGAIIGGGLGASFGLLPAIPGAIVGCIGGAIGGSYASTGTVKPLPGDTVGDTTKTVLVCNY